MEDIEHVVHLSSETVQGCIECVSTLPDNVGEQINHYLDHGYRILHIGTETTRAFEGDVFHNTVALLGKPMVK
jgi:S-adenosylmethionine:tRNA-ribosyltransferase-isomerase (queuine synthetase)